MITETLMLAIVAAIGDQGNPVFKEIVPGKLYIAVEYNERIPDLFIFGSNNNLGEDMGYEDFLKIIDAWIHRTGLMGDLDWDTDDNAWSFTFTLDLYHHAKSIPNWLKSTLAYHLCTEEFITNLPKWVTNPKDRDFIYALAITLTDYYS